MSNPISKITKHVHLLDGKKLRKERIKKKIAAKDLAKLAKISPAFLCDLELERRNCSMRVLLRLAWALEEFK